VVSPLGRRGLPAFGAHSAPPMGDASTARSPGRSALGERRLPRPARPRDNPWICGRPRPAARVDSRLRRRGLCRTRARGARRPRRRYFTRPSLHASLGALRHVHADQAGFPKRSDSAVDLLAPRPHPVGGERGSGVKGPRNSRGPALVHYQLSSPHPILATRLLERAAPKHPDVSRRSGDVLPRRSPLLAGIKLRGVAERRARLPARGASRVPRMGFRCPPPVHRTPSDSPVPSRQPLA